jgi:hypothetical protein
LERVVLAVPVVPALLLSQEALVDPVLLFQVVLAALVLQEVPAVPAVLELYY